MFKYFTTVIIALLLLAACQQNDASDKKHSDLSALSWLAGHWSSNEENPQHEVWNFQNDSTMTGMAYKQRGRRADSKESMRLFVHKGFVFLEATVPNQNAGTPIIFDMTEQTSNSARFENSQHDWPQFIQYNLDPKTGLNIQVGGLAEDAKSLEYTLLRRGDN